MDKLIWKLDYLCIEIISLNINRYCKTDEEGWSIKYLNDIGDKLILACISNSFDDRLNELSYKFILNNFTVKKLTIFPKLFEKINYFDFLNGKSFDELEIILTRELKLKNNENFEFSTNNLKLFFGIEYLYFINSKKIFSNLKVKKEIVIFVHQNYASDKKMEELLLKLLRNTSENIENISIRNYIQPSDNFLIQYSEILKKRKNLKTVNFNFSNASFSDLTFLLSSSLNVKIDYQSLNINHNQYFELFNSVENLSISLPYKKCSDEAMERCDTYLKSQKCDNFKRLHAYLNCAEHPKRYFDNFIKNCQNLKELVLNYFPDFKTILPCSKNLKILHLNYFQIDGIPEKDNFQKFLSESSLEEFNLDVDILTEIFFFNVLEPLEDKCSITSLKISYRTSLPETVSKKLPKFFEKFENLKSLHFKIDDIKEEVLSEILRSLQNSSKTLEEIFLESIFRGCTYIKDGKSLCELLEKCEKLRKIAIDVTINEDNAKEFVTLLKKFEDTLEEIAIHGFWHTDLTYFFSKCSNLKNIRSCSSEEEESPQIFYNSRYSLKVLEFNSVHPIPDSFPHFLMKKIIE